MVSSSFLPGRGGIETYLAELCDLLAPRVAVLAAAEREGRPLPRDLPYPVHAFPGRLLLPGRKALAAIVTAARTEGTDRILFGTPWPLALLGPRLRRAGLHYSVIVHGAEMLVPAAAPVVRARLARALTEADVLFPVSEFTAARIHGFLRGRGMRAPPTEVLRAQVDLARFSPALDTSAVRARYGIRGGDRVVLCFGRLVKRKGVDRMIEAMSAVSAAVPEAVLLVAGTGPEERRLRQLADRGDARVVFAGRVRDEDAGAVYALADVFALPVVDRWFGLEAEGLGVVLLEAAACEVPCVTGRSGGTPEAVLDGVTGRVIDARDPGALAEAVTSLLRDPERAAEMGRAGRAYVEAVFATGPPSALTDWLGPHSPQMPKHST